MKKFNWIAAEKAKHKHSEDNELDYPVSAYCEVMGVSTSGYRQHMSKAAEHDEDEDVGADCEPQVCVEEKVEELFLESKRSYGTRRLKAALIPLGFILSRRRIARIMAQRGLVSVIPRRFKRTTDSKHGGFIAKNIVDRNFSVLAPDKLWLTDITYIRTTSGFMYLAAVLDAFSRRIVGYAIDDHMQAELCERALKMAFKNRSAKRGLIHHSDRGSQYASKSYQKLLRKKKLTCSMSRKGDCWDNAMMESFFGSLKSEHLHVTPLRSKEKTKETVNNWIELWYNHKRLHSSLDMVSPMKFEENYWKQQKNKQKSIAA